MRFSVEAWAPEYGTPTGVGDLEEAQPEVAFDVEVPPAQWAARAPAPGTPDPERILFVDGVRRIDGRVWIVEEDEPNRSKGGVCASYAAGTVLRWNSKAKVATIRVERGLFTCAPSATEIRTKHGSYPVRMVAGDTPQDQTNGVQDRMLELEVEVAREAPEADIVLIDGPLRHRQDIRGAVGYIKTHHISYLPPALEGVLGSLAACQRTPLFVVTTSWSRYSWYLRLTDAVAHPWAGVIRCEASADLQPSDAVELADVVTRAIPGSASAAHKDPRAPQNLYPVGALERELRRRLGDPELLYRALAIAAAQRESA